MVHRESQKGLIAHPSQRAELATANDELQSQLVASEMEILDDMLEMLQQYETALVIKGDACQPIFTACFASVSRFCACTQRSASPKTGR